MYLQPHTTTAYKFAPSCPRSVAPNSHDYALQVHHFTCWNASSKGISILARLRPPSSHDHSLQVPLQPCSITASNHITLHRLQGYGTTGVMERERVMGSIYSADPGVDRNYLILISSYDTMIIHTLSYTTFGLTCSVRDVMDPRICVDPQLLEVSYHLTRLVPSSNQNCSFS